MPDDFKPGHQMDGQYAICPYCGQKHGDCWEWVKEQEKTTECSGCGKEFGVYAEYDVTYHAIPKRSEGERTP